MRKLSLTLEPLKYPRRKRVDNRKRNRRQEKFRRYLGLTSLPRESNPAPPIRWVNGVGSTISRRMDRRVWFFRVKMQTHLYQSQALLTEDEAKRERDRVVFTLIKYGHLTSRGIEYFFPEDVGHESESEHFHKFLTRHYTTT